MAIAKYENVPKLFSMLRAIRLAGNCHSRI